MLAPTRPYHPIDRSLAPTNLRLLRRATLLRNIVQSDAARLAARDEDRRQALKLLAFTAVVITGLLLA